MVIYKTYKIKFICTTNKQGSSYQLVLASDSQNTYAMFNYLNVDVQYQIPAVHMGITDMSGRCQGSYLSGSASMNHFELAKSNTGLNSLYFIKCIHNEKLIHKNYLLLASRYSTISSIVLPGAD